MVGILSPLRTNIFPVMKPNPFTLVHFCLRDPPGHIHTNGQWSLLPLFSLQWFSTLGAHSNHLESFKNNSGSPLEILI